MAYIVFEGLDMSGKSTLSKSVSEHLHARLVMEPFAETESGKAFKKKLVGNELTMEEEIKGFAVSRLDAFKSVIGPYLRHARTVVSDRNVLSSMAYQTVEGTPMEDVFEVSRKLLRDHGYNIQPDVVFFIDIAHSDFVERFNKAVAEGRAIDNKDRMFLDEKVFNGYRDRYLKAIKHFTFYGETIAYILKPEEANTQHVLNLIKEAAMLKEAASNVQRDMKEKSFYSQQAQ